MDERFRRALREALTEVGWPRDIPATSASWKDGIDISVPTPELERFALALCRAYAGEAESAPTGICAICGGVTLDAKICLHD